jgi:O-antigen ligase
MTLRARFLDAFLLIAGALACVAAGMASARRDSLALLLLTGLVGLAVVLIFDQLKFETLVGWIVLTGLVYPFLSIGATHGLLSFDRVVIGGMASWLVLRPSDRTWSPAARWMALALVWLLVSFGVRAALTTSFGSFPVDETNAGHEALNTWLDAIALPVALFFIVAQFADTLARCRRIAVGMAVAGSVLGFLGVAEKLAGFQLASLSGGEARVDDVLHIVRVSGPYPVPETYAMVLLVCLAATLWWTLDRRRPAYALGATAMALEVSGLAVTLFRAALLGAILIFVAGLGLRPGRGLRLIAITLAVGGLTLLAISQLSSSDAVGERVQNTENISGRFATYQQSLRIFALAPVTGAGVGQFVNAQSYVPVTVVSGVKAVTSAHSSFLGLLAEQGAVGILPLLACVLAGWRLLAELRRRSREHADVLLWSCLVGASLAYLVMSGTLSMLPYGPSNAFFAIALGMAAARVNELARLARATPTR